jgi:hypothetical protein
MIPNAKFALDPLDLEIVERALDHVLDAIQSKALSEVESDAALEAALRCELVEMVRFSGVSDPEALRDILVRYDTHRVGEDGGRRLIVGEATKQVQPYTAHAE